MLDAAIRAIYRRAIGRDANVSDVPLLLLRALYGERVSVRTKSGFQIQVDTRDRYVAFKLWRTRAYEASETAFFVRFARPGLRVLDVGANIGYFSVLLGRAVGSTGKVLSLEPAPKTAAICRKNLEINGLLSTVQLLEVAAGPEPSTATLYVDRDHPSNNALYDHRLGGSTLREARQVDVVRLDDVAAEMGPIDLIKIDVEGAELSALKGARETMRGSPTLVICCEVAPRWLRAAGHRPEDLLDEITSHGFEAYEFTVDGVLAAIDPYERAENLERADAGENFCFIRQRAAATFAGAGRVIVRPPTSQRLKVARSDASLRDRPTALPRAAARCPAQPHPTSVE